MVIGFIDNLQKFTQVPTNDKRKIYNSKTTHAMTQILTRASTKQY